MEKVNKKKEVAVHTRRRMVLHWSHWLVLVTCQESGVHQMCVMFILWKASGENYIWLYFASLWAQERALITESWQQQNIKQDVASVNGKNEIKPRKMWGHVIIFSLIKKWVMDLLMCILHCISLLLMVYLFTVLVHCLMKCYVISEVWCKSIVCWVTLTSRPERGKEQEPPPHWF